MLIGFDPIIAETPYVLILGSMPSVASLEKHEYYGYRHNRFWKIMSACFQMPIDHDAQKQQIILSHHLILWDVIHACEREGSLDSSIRKEIVNPIDRLVSDYPTLHTVVCNGKKSESLYQKHFSQHPLRQRDLPSTSNANRTIKEEALFDRWITAFRESFQEEPSLGIVLFFVWLIVSPTDHSVCLLFCKNDQYDCDLRINRKKA